MKLEILLWKLHVCIPYAFLIWKCAHSCDPDYDMIIGNVCYSLHLPEGTWEDGFQICRDQGKVFGYFYKKDDWDFMKNSSDWMVNYKFLEKYGTDAKDNRPWVAIRGKYFGQGMEFVLDKNGCKSEPTVSTMKAWDKFKDEAESAGERRHLHPDDGNLHHDSITKSFTYLCMQNVYDHCTNLVCKNGGVCFKTSDGNEICSCPDNYGGEDCGGGTGNSCVTSADCGAHGTCGQETCFDSTAVSICTCDPGYYGSLCENNDCVPNRCQNGGTCIDEPAQGIYSCNCSEISTESIIYFGDNCEQECDVSLPAWSACSQTCDYGIQFRNIYIFDTKRQRCLRKTAMQPCVDAHCPGYGMSTDSSSAKDYCESTLDGYYTTNACYFIAYSPGKVIFEEAFANCKAQGGEFAKIIDMNILWLQLQRFIMEKIPTHLILLNLQKQQINGDVKGVYFMDSLTEIDMQAAYKMDRNLEVENETLCIQVKSMSSLSGHNSMVYFKEFWRPCDNRIANNALCVYDTKKSANYNHIGKIRVVIVDNTWKKFTASTEKDAYNCGLRCRREDHCIAYNYKESDNTCEPLSVKAGMLTDGKLEGNDQLNPIYTEESLPEWDHYARYL